MESNLILSIIGWVGAVAVLYAYVMLSAGKMVSDSVKYQGWNLLGAVCLIVNTAYNEAYPSTVVNIIWVFIGVYALYRIRKVMNSNEVLVQAKPARIRRFNRFRRKRA